MDTFAQRRQKLANILQAEALDALLLTNPLSVSYLTNFSGESSYLILAHDRALLVSDFRFIEQLAEECPELPTHIRPPAQTVTQAAADAVTKLGYRSVGFEAMHVTVGEFAQLQSLAKTVSWKPVKDCVERLRIIKDDTELAAIREAIDFAERAFTVFRTLLRPDDREKDLADALESYVRRVGGQGTSFPSIVAAGERAALPHAPPTDRAVGSADVLLVDWGASGRFYKSDLTRVLATRRISPKLEEVHTVVLRAQERALGKIRAGVKAHDVDAEARGAIAEAGFGDFFGHGLGHGIGLQIHEAPFMRPESDFVLQAGMVMTVEPGVYLPGWGGVRIEDDVLVTAEGCEILTHLPKRLDSIQVFASP
jgi:Xaa-Pro aminopeptidase